MKRQKIHEREIFTEEETYAVWAKSNGRCAHCGAKKFPQYGATVDHFVPISKGGTNQFINLVPLCADCNKEKTNRIIPPEDYLRFLKPDEYDKVETYFNDYLQSFEYIDRRNLLCCDQYTVRMYEQRVVDLARRKKWKNIPDNMCQKFYFKKALTEDFDRICEYFKKYLIKYDIFGDDEMVRDNIAFWSLYGCIYYEEKDNEIRNMMVVTITDYMYSDAEYADTLPGFSIFVFSYYSSKVSRILANNALHHFANQITREQNLPVAKCMVNILENDPVCLDNLYGRIVEIGKRAYSGVVFNTYPVSEINKDYKKCEDFSFEKMLQEYIDFFKQFKDDRDKMISWISAKDPESLSWLMDTTHIRTDSERQDGVINPTIKRQEINVSNLMEQFNTLYKERVEL